MKRLRWSGFPKRWTRSELPPKNSSNIATLPLSSAALGNIGQILGQNFYSRGIATLKRLVKTEYMPYIRICPRILQCVGYRGWQSAVHQKISEYKVPKNVKTVGFQLNPMHVYSRSKVQCVK